MISAPLMVRSKNAGPFTMTIDVMFADPADAEELYGYLSSSNPDSLLGSLSLPGPQIFLDRTAAAVKITTGRRVPAGAFGDEDIYGCQQHLGVLAAVRELVDGTPQESDPKP